MHRLTVVTEFLRTLILAYDWVVKAYYIRYYYWNLVKRLLARGLPTMFKKAHVYFNTVRYLRLKQIYYQAKNRFFRTQPPNGFCTKPQRNYLPRLSIRELDLDHDYLARFDVNGLLDNHIRVLHEGFVFRHKWCNPNASHLWNFNLHYLEFLVPLAATYKRVGDSEFYNKFKEYLTSWISFNNEYNGDGWHPYTISLRIPNLFICFDLFGEIFDEDKAFKAMALNSIYEQYQFLLRCQELHLLGNHYFENLKTIVICSVCFGDEKTYNRYLKRLLKQLDEQLLKDGLHFELSLMYHKIVLEGILRVIACLDGKCLQDSHLFRPYVQKMIDALASLEKGMGKTPLFNDAGDGISKDTPQLLKAASQLLGITPSYKNMFPYSGYYKLYKGNIAIMFDAGKMGPDYMTGHAHCDALSFELSIDSKPVFVNSGTYQYQTDLRQFFRSTRAHNTVMIGDEEQSECWGEHRTGRRLRNVRLQEIEGGISGSYENYRGSRHLRKLYFEDDSKLIIIDSVKTKSKDIVRSYFHVAPNLSIKEENDYYLVLAETGETVCTVSAYGVRQGLLHREGTLTSYSPEFGVLQTKQVIEFLWTDSCRSVKIILDFNS